MYQCQCSQQSTSINVNSIKIDQVQQNHSAPTKSTGIFGIHTAYHFNTIHMHHSHTPEQIQATTCFHPITTPEIFFY